MDKNTDKLVKAIQSYNYYSFEEQEIAKVISAEACSEGFIGMYGVGNTIANRVKLYNKTPYEVVIQENQFYGYTAKNKEKLFSQCKKDSLYIAENLMTLEDITGNALYFKRPEEKLKSWHKEKTVTINNHEFWR